MATLDEHIQSADIVVFSSSWCPYCKRAIAALKDAGYEPKVVDAGGPLREALEERTGQDTVPQVFVKGTFIGGCNDGGLGGTLPLLKSGKVKELLEGGGGAPAAKEAEEPEPEGGAEAEAKAPTLDDHLRSADIVVFSSSWCPYCKKAIAALKEAGYEPKVVDAGGPLREELEERTGQDTVPQVFVKGTFIGGCNDGGLGGTLPLLKSGKIKALLEGQAAEGQEGE